jgi:hypothetical protein
MSLTQVINGLLADGAITTAKLADASVGTAKLVDANVTAAKMAANSVATANIVDANVTAAKLANASVTTAKLANSGYELGPRNRIINGAMNISQRGATFAALASGAYCLDRFSFTNTSAGVVTATQNADVPGDLQFQKSLRLTVTTADASVAAGDLMTIGQRVEGYNVRDLIGKTFTLSFWVRSSKTGTHCVYFANSTPDRSYVAEYTVLAANTWEFKTITVSGGLITAGTWDWEDGIGLRVNWTLAGGSTYQTTAGAWQTGSYVATSAQVNCLDTIGNIFAITGVQLEAGGSATPFDYSDYATEFARCQRYYEQCGFVATATSPPFTSIRYAVNKRAVPSSLTVIGAAIAPATLNTRSSTDYFSMDGNAAASVPTVVAVYSEL